MTVPPLFDPLDTEDDDQLRRDAAPRETSLSASGGPGVDDDAHPAGTHPRLRAWLHVEPFYWTMRVVYVCLAAGAIFAVYINGVAEGWWRAWGEKPSVAATTPATQPTPASSVSSEAAMSGGYQIGPDGVLIRPAQFAADTYTKPELPEEAKENTEREQNSRRNTSLQRSPTRGTPAILSHSLTSRNRERSSAKHTLTASIGYTRTAGCTTTKPP